MFSYFCHSLLTNGLRNPASEYERVVGWGASDAVPHSRDGVGCHFDFVTQSAKSTAG